VKEEESPSSTQGESKEDIVQNPDDQAGVAGDGLALLVN